jgi:dihydrofolate reductase
VIIVEKGETVRKLIVFNHVTLDGYFVSAGGDMSWAKQGNDDMEYQEFVAENAGGDGQLIFGRVTYQMMASYWPTPLAEQHMPEVAAGMNRMPKTVFSTTLKEATWNNSQLIKDDIVEAVRKMKNEPGPGMTILGSGSIVAQLAPENMIDEYQIMLDPVALGKGRTMFDGIREMLTLKLTRSRTFKNGKVFLCYKTI